MHARSLLILLSPQSIERQWVLVELGGAWALDKRIVAITYDVPRERIPDIIDHDRSYELNDFDRYVAELVRRARREQEGKGRGYERRGKPA